MSINTSYTTFNQQLLLKLTLGQQFKQQLQVPELLKNYYTPSVEDTAELLKLNQLWVLTQQVGYQTQTVDAQVLQQFEQERALVVDDDREYISDELYSILVDTKDYGGEENWQLQVLKLAQQQNKLIPSRFYLHLLRSIRRAFYVYILKDILPDIVFQYKINLAKAKNLKVLHSYAKKNDAKPLVKYLKGLKDSYWQSEISSLCSQEPEFIINNIAQIWQDFLPNRKPHNSHKVAIEMSFLSKQFESVYQYFKSLPNQDMVMVEENGIALLYLCYEDNFFSQQAIPLLKQCLAYNAEQKKIILTTNLEQDSQLEDYDLLTTEGNFSESRKLLREILKRDDPSQPYRDFLTTAQSVVYFKQLLRVLPLKYWLEILGQWDNVLTLDAQQKEQVWDILIERCTHEKNHDLALWFYQHQADWCEGLFKQSKNYSMYKEARIFRLVAALSIGQQFLIERLKYNLDQKALENFWFILKYNQSELVSTVEVTELVIQALALEYTETGATDEFRTHIIWIMLHGYPIDFTPYQYDISEKNRRMLDILLQEKRKLLNQTL